MIRKSLSSLLGVSTLLATAAAILVTASLVLTGCAALGDKGPSAEDPAGSPASPLSVEEALELPSGEAVWVQGSLLYSEGELRLYSALAESYPPQCGGASLPLLGLRANDIPGLTRAKQEREEPEVAWSDFPATLRGTLAEGTFVASLPPAWEATSAGITVRSGHLPEKLATGFKLNWLFDLVNTTSSAVDLTFPTGQKGDVVLADDSGPIYRWSEGRAFTQAIHTITLAPGETMGFALGDELDIAPGTYDFQATIDTSDHKFPTVTGRVTVQSEVK